MVEKLERIRLRMAEAKQAQTIHHDKMVAHVLTGFTK
jgi:hypothetical protein